MEGLRTILLLLVTNVFVSQAIDKSRTNIPEDKTWLVGRTVKTMLGLKDIPSGTHLPPKPPKYMLDLYEKYQSGGDPQSMEKTFGNTVRSIMADVGFVDDRQMFLFNLSSLQNSEKLFGGELHIYKKRMKGRAGEGDVLLHLYEISKKSVKPINTVVLSQESYGWQAVNIMVALRACFTSHGHGPNILGISPTVRKANGKLGSLALRKFIHHMSQPFVITFSNDTQNITLDHIDPYFKPLDQPLIDPETGSSYRHHLQFDEPPVARNDILSKRKRRSIFDNEIPDNPMEPVRKPMDFNIPQTNPDILLSRSNSHRSRSDKLIPYPEDHKTSKRRKKNRRNRKRYNRKLPFLEDLEKPENAASSWGSKQLCGKRPLVVDFADIGWSEWIISPKQFEAHYCTGSCPFPMTRGLKPSNHATVQSLVHAIGIHGDVPAPCCVPESLSSITLLYFDENRNVVLKNYPGMTVQSCGCR